MGASHTVSTPAPNGDPTVYAISRSDIPRFSCSSKTCFAKQAGETPRATLSRTSSISSVYSFMSFCRCSRTFAFHGANMLGTYLRAGYRSTANLPGMLGGRMSQVQGFSRRTLTYLTEVRRPIDSALRCTTISVDTSSTRLPYVIVTITDAAYLSRCLRKSSGLTRRSCISTFDSRL